MTNIKTILLIITTLFLLTINSTSLAKNFNTQWDLKNYKGMSNKELLEHSYSSMFVSEKAILRAYLAHSAPKTEYGYFANAWFNNKNKKISTKYNDNCLAVNPNYQPCLLYASSVLTDEDKIAILQKNYNISPTYSSYYSLKTLYSALKEKNQQRADDFLNDYMAKNPNSYIRDHIKGLDAYYSSKYAKAADLLQSAIDKGSDYFQTYEVLAKIKTKYLNSRYKDKGNKRDLVINLLKEYINNNPEQAKSAEPYYTSGELLEGLKGKNATSLELYITAFKYQPVAEVLGKITNPYYISTDFNKVKKVVELAIKEHSKNPWMLIEISEFYLYSMASDDIGINFAKKGMDSAHSEYSYDIIRNRYVEQLNRIGRFEDAMSIIQADLSTGIKNKKFLISAIDTAANMAQYHLALDLLEKRNNLGGLRKDWYSSKKENLLRYQSGVDKQVDYLNDNKFLSYWQKKVGKSLTIQIEFPTGKAVIPKKYYAELNKIAPLLTHIEAQKYTFNVEGHTDNTGNTTINNALSKKRAKAVANYFINKHGVGKDNLNVEGFGSRFPVASNTGSDGRKQNRRVEIIPVGKLTSPKILATGNLSVKGSFALSPDGHTIALGHSPIEIWDTRIEAKKGEIFGRGTKSNFSPSGRYIVARSNWTDIFGISTVEVNVFDTKTGFPEKQIIVSNNVKKAVWGPFGERLAFIDKSGRLFVYDLDKKSALLSFQASTITIPGEVLWSKNGKYLYTGMARDNVIRVWDANTGELKQALSGVSWVHAIGQSYNGKYLVANDNRGKLTVWDTDTWEERSMDIGLSTKNITAHPSEQHIILNSFNGNTTNKAILFDLVNMAVLNSKNVAKKTFFAFNADASELYQVGNRISRLNPNTLREVSEFKSQSSNTFAISAVPKYNYLVSHSDDSTLVWDVTTGKKIHTWPIKTYQFRSTSNDDNSYSVIKDTVFKVNFDDFTLSEFISLGFNTRKTVLSNKYLLTSPMQEGNINKHGTIKLYNLETGKNIADYSVDYITDELQYSTLNDAGISELAINEKLDVFAYNTFWQDGYGRANTYSKTIRIHQLSTGRLLQEVVVDDEINNLSFDGSKLVVKIDNKLKYYNVKTGEYKPELTRDVVTGMVNFESDNLLVTNSLAYATIIHKKTQRKQLLHFNDNLQQVTVFPKQNLIISLLKNSEIKFFAFDTLKEHLTLITKDNNEWISYVPTGQYDASINGTEQVFWSLGDKLLPLNTLKNKFYQPQLIQQRLTAIKNKSSSLLNQIETRSLVPTDILSPTYTLTLISKRQLETQEDNYNLTYKLNKIKSNTAPVKLVISVNGQTISHSRGLKRVTKNNTQTIKIPIEFGRNIIQLAIDHKGALLDQQTIIVNKTNQENHTVSNQHLWFFGVGVSDYQSHEQSLEYAHKDATMLAEYFQSQQGKLFSNVHTKVLVNSDVTARNVRVEMSRFLKQASSEDTIIIFIAGHGVQDNEQTLYFMPYDSDISEPITGMEVSNFQRFLTKRPASQKALFWMDICHAGALGEHNRRGQITPAEAVKMLAQGTGVAVIASSTGRESSLESKQFGGGHGAFTAGLLEGLKGKADTVSGNKDGFVSLHELHSYVSRRVPQITNGQQHPTTPTMSNVRDFPLTKSQN